MDSILANSILANQSCKDNNRYSDVANQKLLHEVYYNT